LDFASAGESGLVWAIARSVNRLGALKPAD